MDTMIKTRGMMLHSKRDFVHKLNDIFAVMDEFNAIEYSCSYITDQEYLKISDSIGNVVFMNVTAFSEEEILRDICKVVASGDLPFSIIHDTATKKKIAHLFR
jgi:hypothetical protein